MRNCMISIIIPAYNVEKYIIQCINSCLKQTYKNIEIIVIDDGSNDRTSARVEEEYEHYNNVILIKQQNAGVSVARNVGIEVARGEYLFFLDGDDLIHPKLLEFFLSKGTADIISANRYFFNSDEEGNDFLKKETLEIVQDKSTYEKYDYKEAMKAILRGQTTSGIGQIISRRAINNIRFKRGIRHNEDKLFLFGCISKGLSFERLNYQLYGQRKREDSASQQKFNFSHMDMLSVAEEISHIVSSSDKYIDIKKTAKLHEILIIQSIIRCIARSGQTKDDFNLFFVLRQELKTRMKKYDYEAIPIKMRIEQGVIMLPFVLYKSFVFAYDLLLKT